MQKDVMTFVKGLGAGMAAGAGVTLVGKMVLQNKNGMSKGSAKVVKAAGEFIDGIYTMFK